MERTESKVIQVAPAHENSMIKENELFGWSLQGRQEMHVEGDTRPDLSISGIIGDWGSETRTYVTEVKRYVKLHFSRSMNLPNLDGVRKIESEYYNLPFPNPSTPSTKMTPLDILILLMWLVGGGGLLLIFIGDFGLGLVFVLMAVGIFLGANQLDRKIKTRRKKEEEKCKQIRDQSRRRAEELLVQLKKLGCETENFLLEAPREVASEFGALGLKKSPPHLSFCSQCGAKVSPDNAFCSECGHSLK